MQKRICARFTFIIVSILLTSISFTYASSPITTSTALGMTEVSVQEKGQQILDTVVGTKDLGTTYSTLYIREYVYVQSFPSVWNPFSVLWTLDASYGSGASAGVYNDGGTQKFAIFGPSSNAVSSVTVSANTRYCLELKRVSGSGSGQLVLYVDGQQACSLYSQTLNDGRYVYAGSIWSGTSCSACIDAFAANTNYIGT